MSGLFRKIFNRYFKHFSTRLLASWNFGKFNAW